jgi:hypothetical protein
MARVLVRRFAALAASAALLSGVAVGAGSTAYAAASAPHTLAAKVTSDPWGRAVDKKHDRHEGRYYWRESGGVKARWNATHRHWERQVGHRWEHWNGHRWVA